MSLNEPSHAFVYNSETKEVLLDGVNIASSLTHLEVLGTPRGQEVVLHLTPNHSIDVSGYATVSVAVDDAAATIAEFLDTVDAETLEARALLEHAGGGSVTPVILSRLRRMALGEE
jgi:hypothetical protein